MVKSRLFKAAYGRELFGIAENDLDAARTLAQNSIVRLETCLLMVQQAIEKSLKAVLCHHGSEVPQTHDIEFLVDRLTNIPSSLPTVLTETDFGDLSTFATLRRYEEGRSVIGRDEAQAAIVLAQEILDWSRKEIFS